METGQTVQRVGEKTESVVSVTILKLYLFNVSMFSEELMFTQSCYSNPFPNRIIFGVVMNNNEEDFMINKLILGQCYIHEWKV